MGEISITRREALAIAAAGGASLCTTSLALDQAEPRRGGGAAVSPRNIIFMVSDGMSMGAVSMAEEFSRLVRGGGTRWYDLLGAAGATHGLLVTSSLDSLVTDSAAASSAWGGGSRVANGAINTLPDGRPLVPIGRLVRDAGRRVGLVTTTTITHATPAGFAAIQAKRDDEHLIAPQYLGACDVLLGGGRKFFDRGLRADQRDLIDEYRGAGYALWERRDAVVGVDRPRQVLGLFSDGHMPYTVDHRNHPELPGTTPTLAEMTRAALEIMSASGEGFLLQVEGGRVDHAAHANDAAALLWDQLAFDDAVQVALAFAARRPDTLVLITSDHGNANPGLNGTGPEYRLTNPSFAKLAAVRASFETIAPKLADSPTDEGVQRIVQENLGASLSAVEADAVARAAAGKLDSVLQRQHAKLVGVLGQALANHFGVGWTGTSHTQDWVLLTAVGPGAERFAGIRHHVDVFRLICDFWGISHRNPEAPASQAVAAATAGVQDSPAWSKLASRPWGGGQ